MQPGQVGRFYTRIMTIRILFSLMFVSGIALLALLLLTSCASEDAGSTAPGRMATLARKITIIPTLAPVVPASPNQPRLQASMPRLRDSAPIAAFTQATRSPKLRQIKPSGRLHPALATGLGLPRRSLQTL